MASSGPAYDDEDPVVQEGDVHIHNGLAGSLHLLSFPLRPVSQEIELPSAVRIRPTKYNIEYEYAIDTRGEHFDERARGDPKLARVRLRSAEVPLKYMQMAAVVRDGTLHLTPITAQHVMRPDMSHLEAAAETSSGSAGAGASSSSAPTKVQMQIRRKDVDGRAEAWKRASWGYHAGQEEADVWVELSRLKTDGNRGKAIAALLASDGQGQAGEGRLNKRAAIAIDDDDDDDDMQGSSGAAAGSSRAGRGGSSSGPSGALDLSQEDAQAMLQALTIATAAGTAAGSAGRRPDAWGGHGPGSANGGVAVVGSASSTASASLLATSGGAAITLSALESQPAPIQVEEALRRAHVLPTLRLLEVMSTAASLDEAVTLLDKMCRLVRGNWVLRSDVHFSPHWRERLKHVASSEGGAGAGSSAGASRVSSTGGSRGARGPRSAKLNPALLAARIAVRDYILCQFAFSADACVNVDDVCGAMGLLPRSVIPLLDELGTRLPDGTTAALVGGLAMGPNTSGSRVWRFKRPDDQDFASRFPKLADGATRWWKRRDTELAGYFHDKREKVQAAGRAFPPAPGYAEPVPGARRGTVGLAGPPGFQLPDWMMVAETEPAGAGASAAGGAGGDDDMLGLGLPSGSGIQPHPAPAGRGRSGSRGSASVRSRAGSASSAAGGHDASEAASGVRGKTPAARGRARSRASSALSEASDVDASPATGEAGTDLNAIDNMTAAALGKGKAGSGAEAGAGAGKASGAAEVKKGGKAATDKTATSASASAAAAAGAGASGRAATADEVTGPHPPAAGAGASSSGAAARNRSRSGSMVEGLLPGFSPGVPPTLPPLARDADGARVRDGLSTSHSNTLTDMLRDTLRRAGVMSIAALVKKIDDNADTPVVTALNEAIDRLATEEVGPAPAPPAAGASKLALLQANAAKAQHDLALMARSEELKHAVIRATLSEFASAVPSPATDLFVMRSSGSAQSDRYRPTLVHLLAARGYGEGKPGVKKADIKDAVRVYLGDDDLPSQLYTRLMKELASAVGGIWRLKAGDEDGDGADAGAAADG